LSEIKLDIRQLYTAHVP